MPFANCFLALVFLALWLGFTPLQSSAQDLLPVPFDGKWGYINLAGTFVIPPLYDEAYPFHDGRAAVFRKDKGWIYIDSMGRRCLGHNWFFASVFRDGLALVGKTESRWAFITTSGKEIYRFNSRDIIVSTIFYNGVAFQLTGDSKFIELTLLNGNMVCKTDEFNKEHELYIWDLIPYSDLQFARLKPEHPKDSAFSFQGRLYYRRMSEDSLCFIFSENKTLALINVNSGATLCRQIKSIGFYPKPNEYPSIVYYDFRGWKHLPVVLDNNKMAYINRKGEFVWLQK